MVLKPSKSTYLWNNNPLLWVFPVLPKVRPNWEFLPAGDGEEPSVCPGSLCEEHGAVAQPWGAGSAGGMVRGSYVRLVSKMVLRRRKKL